ncbi:MAG: hypothetical protein AMXMBFR16_10360 [Candidatus Uhrbacteria bacterium]
MLRWIDGFDNIGANAANGSTLWNAIAKKYNKMSTIPGSGGTPIIVSGWGGQGLALDWHRGDNTLYISKSFDLRSTWIVGFAMKTPPFLSSSWLLQFINQSTTQSGLYVSDTGVLHFLRGDSIGSYRAASWGGFKTSTWYYVEIKLYMHAASGTAEVYVNGTKVIDYTGNTVKDTASAHVIQFNNWYTTSGSYSSVIDDIYIADDQAGVNAVLGPSKIESLIPTADTANADWTPSGANHYGMLDENPPAAADYVESNTANQLDLYDFSNLANVSVNIKGVQIEAAAQLTTAGMQTLKLVAKSGSTQDDGTGINVVDTAYTQVERILESDPNTNAAWTAANINSAQFGLKVG